MWWFIYANYSWQLFVRRGHVTRVCIWFRCVNLIFENLIAPLNCTQLNILVLISGYFLIIMSISFINDLIHLRGYWFLASCLAKSYLLLFRRHWSVQFLEISRLLPLQNQAPAQNFRSIFWYPLFLCFLFELITRACRGLCSINGSIGDLENAMTLLMLSNWLGNLFLGPIYKSG